MRIILIFTILILATTLQAQSITQSVIPVAGDFTSNSSKLSWTLGEPISDTKTKDFHLTEGFQQGLMDNFHQDSINLTSERNDNETVEVEWTTYSELNSKGFYIERRLETETEFETIGYVRGKNNKTTETTYTFTDDNDFTEIAYYRVQQVKNNDKFQYSNTDLAEGIALIEAISVFPNPTVDNISVRFNVTNLEDVKNVQVKVFDHTGRLVTEQNEIEITQSEDKVIQNVSQLNAGTYVLVVIADNQIINKFPFIKSSNFAR